MKKIAILSDIHGNLPALEAVVDDFTSRNVEAVINLGDHISGPLWPKETLQFLMRQDWIQIKGNHDRQLSDLPPAAHGPSDRYAFQYLETVEVDWLRSLPAIQTVQDEILLVHGTHASDTTYFLETVASGRTRLATPAEILDRRGSFRTPVILCGHTHIPRLVETRDHTLIINPGSVGLPAYEDSTPEYHIVENGSPHARYAILESRNGRWIPEWVAVAYDADRAASQALRNARPDWETALRTGFMQPV